MSGVRDKNQKRCICDSFKYPALLAQGCLFEREIEIIEANINGFLEAAIENKDVESVVDSAILLKKLDNPELISFVKEQIEGLQKSPEKADKEKLINISEKISGIEK